MFCPECGASLPEGTTFCSECGAKLAAAQPAAPVYPSQPAAPVYQSQLAAPAYHSAPLNPLKKGDYVKQQGSPAVKTASMVTLILLVVCFAIMIFGHIAMLNTSIEDIPVMSMALEATGEEDTFDDLKDELEDELDLLELEYELVEDDLEDLDAKDLKKLDQFFEVMEDTVDTMSISNMRKLIDVMEDVSETDAVEHLDLAGSVEELEEVDAIFGTVSTVLLIASMLSLLFTLIGGLIRNKVLVVLGAIGSAIFAAVLYGFLFVLLVLAAHVGMFVMISKIDGEYKAYRNGTVAY